MPARAEKWKLYRTASVIVALAAALWLVSFSVATAIFEPGVRAAAPGAIQTPVRHPSAQSGAASTGAGESLRARFERLPAGEVKRYYARCSRESSARRLEGGEAMACSVAYEVLLTAYFDNDFHALLQWSRADGAPQ